MIRRLLTSSLVLALSSAAVAQSQLQSALPIGARPQAATPALPPAPLLVGGSDQCSAAAASDAITGLGMFAFDNTTATTGPEGQFNTLCNYFNNANLVGDVWFVWTAPAPGGTCVLTTCGTTTVDTKIAVYNNAPCASLGAPLACNEDLSATNGQSKVVFQAVPGSQYLIQIGMYPGAPAAIPGTGMFTISYATFGCSVSSGTTDNAISWVNNTQIMWMQRLGDLGANTAITAVNVAYGSALAGPAQSPAVGTAATVFVYEDPNDDSNPNDGTILSQVATTVQNPGTDMLNQVMLPTPVTASGYFFVAVLLPNPAAGIFAAPIDGQCTTIPGSSWLAGSQSTFDPINLGTNTVPPTDMQRLNLNAVTLAGGVFLISADCTSASTGMGFCFGDGTGAACPCANNGAPGNGCASSINANGGNIAGTGVPSLTNDNVTLLGSGMTNTNCLYFQGTAQQSAGAGVAFGDGKRCAGGQIVRLKTVVNVNGSSQYPQAGDPPVSVRGLVTMTGDRTYQVWYRNAAAFCTPDTFNLTNGLAVTWGP